MSKVTTILQELGKEIGFIFFFILLTVMIFAPTALAQDEGDPLQVLEQPSPDFAPLSNDIDSPNALSVVNIWRVSVASNGAQANTPSTSGIRAISTDGRYVTFESAASNLVVGDTNGGYDVFVHDRLTGQTSRVSVASDGTQGNGASNRPSISGDGRYVAFQSYASNLVLGDTNGVWDVFVHDRLTGQTSRVSVASDGTQGNDRSGQLGISISGDGRYVAFQSYANNLVPGDTNNRGDVFVHDRLTGQTSRVSVASNGTQSNNLSKYPAISADGNYVAFDSAANNLVAGDTNGGYDVFVHDRLTGQTSRVSVASNGTQGNGSSSSDRPSISGDGRYVAFHSAASNLVSGDTNGVWDAFVHDRLTGQTTRVSVASNGTQGNHWSEYPSISDDGRYVVFESHASNLVLGDTNGRSDIFVHDRQTGQTIRVSIANDGMQGNLNSEYPSISGNSRYVAFHSAASNLVPGDTNREWDEFVVELSTDNSASHAPSTLALFNPSTRQASLLNMLADNPPVSAYNTFPTGSDITNGQWVMGDWNGDGTDTSGVFSGGAFFLTNDSGTTSNWSGYWVGPNGIAVVGRFDGSRANDCIGVLEQATFGQFTVFALYYACDLTTTTPPVTWHWVSAPLPDAGGFSGAFQFAMGDWNGDGLDTPAARRGPYIAWSNVPIVNPNAQAPQTPQNTYAEFSLAQYFDMREGANYGQFVGGDWNGNSISHFGVLYDNGHFHYNVQNEWSPTGFSLQRISNPLGTPLNVTSWRGGVGTLRSDEAPNMGLEVLSNTEFEPLQPLHSLSDLQLLD